MSRGGREYVPPGYRDRITAVTKIIRWGPSCFTGPEFLILLWVAERTLTYGKQSDASSFSQMTDGIKSLRRGGPIRVVAALARLPLSKR